MPLSYNENTPRKHAQNGRDAPILRGFLPIIRADKWRRRFLPLFVRYLLAFLWCVVYLQAQKIRAKNVCLRGAAARFYLFPLRVFLFLVFVCFFLCHSLFLFIVRLFPFLSLFSFRLCVVISFPFPSFPLLSFSFVRWFSFFALLYSCTLFL